MNRSSRLSRAVTTVASRVVSSEVAREMGDDLANDYERARATRGGMRARLWLIKEIATLSISFGGAALRRGLRLTPLLARDITHAARSIRRRPIVGLSVIGMLGLGLAAVLISSSLAATLLFRPINPRDPDSVRRLGTLDRSGKTALRLSKIEIDTIRPRLSGTAELASVTLQPVVMHIADSDVQTMVEVTSGNYFAVVGGETQSGRSLFEADAREGASPVAVISDALWTRRFNRSTSALGTTIQLNGASFTIVGVAAGTGPSTFIGGGVDAWVTTANADAVLDRGWRTNLAQRAWTALVHAAPALRPQVDARLADATAMLATEHPDAWRERILMTLPGTMLAGSQRDAARVFGIVLGALSTLILIAAAANVGSMMLASAAAEQGRAAILLAIGAGRAALVRRQLIEGALLGAGAGGVAVAVYAWARQGLADVALLPTLALRFDLPLDGSVVTVALGTGLAAGVLLAAGPAFWSTRLDLAQTLRDGSARSAGRVGLSRARRVLVAAQVAISLTLLVSAALLSKSLSSLATIDIGFPRTGLVAMDFDSEPSAPAVAELPALAREALRRAGTVPGVTSAAMSNRAPVDSSTPAVEVRRSDTASVAIPDVTFYLASEGYFQTVGVPIVQGRAFTTDETNRELDVAVVNETLAAKLWPDGDALGRALTLHPQQRSVRVIGIARNSKYRSLFEPLRPHLYLPTAPRFSLALLVRTRSDPAKTLASVQRAFNELAPGVVGFFPRTLEDHLAIDLLPARAAGRAAAWLGALALALSTAGLYGIVMWFVEARRREIGVRLALGAAANDVRRLVIGQAAVAAGPGIIVGVLLAVGLATLSRSLLVGVGPFDPIVLTGAVVALVLVVLVASYIPSCRATSVDPLIVLRDS